MSNSTGAMRRPGWTGFRVARPARDLAVSSVLYRDLLRLESRGGFENHDGYDGVFFALPGGGELELTAGPVAPSGGTDEDLLVLYVSTLEEVRAIGASLSAAGVPNIESPNTYWNRFGQTFLDPDGYRVVIAAASSDAGADKRDDVRIEWHEGPRASLRPLFELAEDSASQLDQYLELGRVLVARRGDAILGHLQLVRGAQPGEIELKSLAVVPEERGTGLGRTLVRSAVQRTASEGWWRMVVSTGAADTGNLRFYQRVGFRLLSIDRDAFTPATGYPDPIVIDGIPLLDRVWLSQDILA
jgi:GNAT superfamily N-acetyltransferase